MHDFFNYSFDYSLVADIIYEVHLLQHCTSITFTEYYDVMGWKLFHQV